MSNRILIVDDEPSIRHLLRSVLANEQYEVETAGSTLEALSQLQETSFDIAIVDLLLPGPNGLILAEAIRVLDPGTPIVLITAYGSPSFETMASHPAVTHYVHKPFTIERLLDVVQECLTAR
ncbi:MAG: response regulator [Anaerolineae bacterium]|nr:response regulator [Anaerolineae bacterium]